MASDRRDLVRSWLQKASHDLETARRVIEREPPITDTAVYHCQQAAEKALKAVIIRHEQPVFKTHDLMALTTHCANIDPDFEDWIDAAAILTPYATHYRYPGNEPDPDLAETIEAIDLATALVGFVQRKLSADGIFDLRPGDPGDAL